MVCVLVQFIKVQRTKKRVVAVKSGELSIQLIMIMSMTGPLGHRDINVIAKRNSTKASQVTKKMLHQFQKKQNKHDKSECLIPVSVTKYQTVTFIMNGSDYLPLLTVAPLAPQSEHK